MYQAYINYKYYSYTTGEAKVEIITSNDPLSLDAHGNKTGTGPIIVVNKQ
jgi:hypothetical protein